MNPEDTLETRIYLVDDEVENVKLLKDILISIGYKNNYPFTNGQEAVNHLKNNKPLTQEPVILLSDACMPIMGGEEVIKNFIKIYNNVLAALITGSLGEKDAANAGALAYMRKPTSIRRIEQITNFFSALGQGKLSEEEIEAFPNNFYSDETKIIIPNLETYIKNNLLPIKAIEARRVTSKALITPIYTPPKTEYSLP